MRARRKIFAVWLLASTAFYPTQANAMPILAGFIGGLVTALGAGAAGGAIAGIGGGFAAGAFAAGYGFVGALGGSAIFKLALSIGVSLLAAALRPKPQTPDPGQKVVNLRQPISFFEFAYGRVRKGGPVNFWQADGGRRFVDVIIAAREIEGYVSRFLDEREATINFADENFAEPEGWFERRIRLEEFTGAPGQISPPFLNDNFTEWTNDHDMAGLAHATMICRNAKPDDFSGVYPSGREPVYTALVDGFKVYDPRDVAQDENDSTTWEYSNNAALVIADWAVSTDGLGRAVNWDKVAIEADKADVEVLDRDGNLRKKWQLAGTYSSADERETVRANMGVACDAMFYEDDDGTVGFYVGGYEEPDITIVDDDILRVQYSEGQPGTDIKNSMVISYTEPEQGYREAASAPYIIDDPSEAYSEDALNVFWIPNHNQAVRVAKRLLLVSRAKYQMSAILKYEGIRLKGRRFFRLQHSEFNGLDMVFEVDKLSRNEDGITFTLDAHSVTEADFDFNAAVEEPAKPLRNGITTNSSTPEPEGVTATVEIFAGAPTVLVEWDDPPRDSLLNRVRYRNQDGPGEWFVLSTPIGQYYQRIVGLDDGATYDIQVQAMTPTGRASKWVPNNAGDEDDPTLEVDILIDPTAPLTLSSLAAVGGMGNAAVTFATASGDAHIRTVGIYRVATGAGAPTAADTPLAQVLVSAGSTFTYTDGDGTRTNMLENPGFDSDTLWTKSSAWTIAAGVAHKANTAGNSISQTDTYANGSNYRAKFEIVAISGGTLTPRLTGGTTVGPTAYNTTGTKYQTFAAVTGNNAFGFIGQTATVADIDNVVLFLETAASVAQGDYDYYAIPFNQSGIDGPVSGPVTVTII